MDTFVVDVSGTRGETWQGTVKCGDRKTGFLSTLEMLKAIDNALERGELPAGNTPDFTAPER